MVPDHWTWRDGKAYATGWHVKSKRGKQLAEPEPVAVSRGLVTTSTPRPKTAKPSQGQLL